MSQWTDAALTELERYFTRVRPTLAASGADADEVIEDLRRHLDIEVQTAKLAVVTEEDVRRLLARIGAPQPAEQPIHSTPATEPSAAPQKPVPPKGGYFLLFFGVVLPTFTLGFELVTGACAGAFFDPMPSFWHVLLVALVPLVNGLAWAALRRGDARWQTWLGWANGVGLGVAIFYSILYAPLMLPGIVGVIFFGFGLLPLTPVISLVATLLLRQKLRRFGGNVALPGFWRGIGMAWLALLALAAPVAVTKLAMHKAISAEPEEQLSGIRWLRRFGREETMLRACYGYTARAANADLSDWLVAGADRVSAEQARRIYFRVMGQPFNSVPAPTVRTGRGTWAELNEWTWDDDQGGSSVGGRLKGLFLHSSRLDTTINADAAWSYTEWTMEFRNDARQQREARAQILLPPGGVVSRLTLWVNGEEREAAFAGRSQTRQAYQQVAIQQRRDPVLVTTAGPDRVLMQCFPVPPNGGIMKIRIGVTAPLALVNAGEGAVRLPVILERNFTLRKGFRHAIWAQAAPGLKCDSPQLALEPSNDGQVALRGQLDDAALNSPTAVLGVTRDGTRRFAWTKDLRDTTNQFIRQTITDEPLPVPTKLIFVVDGSARMRPHWDAIIAALAQSPANAPQTILVASDEVTTLAGPAELKTVTPAGGQDNLPALLAAWNLAVPTPGSVIVWIHGPQPIQLESDQALRQALERPPARPALYEIQTEPGPDQVVNQMEGVRSLLSVWRTGDLAQDLGRLFRALGGAGQTWKIERTPVASQSEAAADGAVESSPHLARLWASDTISRLQAERKTDEAVRLAGLYQIVTPVSGAVVLETQQQYAQTGLTPAEPQTVPAIPEPATWALMALGLVAAWWARRRAIVVRATC